MAWSFGKQLSVGKQGERLLLKEWPLPIRRRYEDLTGVDFVDSHGSLIELKTETRSVDETPNFFMERWSDKEGGRPGGPWQALSKGATCYVIHFMGSKSWFTFGDLPTLVQRLEALLPTLKPILIKNEGWTTEGYAVPREALLGLYKEGLSPIQERKQ